MVKITIENLAQKEVVSNAHGISVLKIVQAGFIDWLHACGGKGRCTTCKFVVVRGDDFLSPLTTVELNYRTRGELKDNERLACQAIPTGSCVIRVPEECKLPHQQYSA